MTNPIKRLASWLGIGSKPALQARYDSAQTTPTNRGHWASADDLGPATANNALVARTLRRRARYERDNNGMLSGLTRTMSVDFLGCGPRLSLNSTADTYTDAHLVESAFGAWWKAAGITEKLRLMVEPAPVDGEEFGVLFTNPETRNPVKLDVRVVEPEQVTFGGFGPYTVEMLLGRVDGIEYDTLGNPVTYSVLRKHPGDGYAYDEVLGQQIDRIPAKFVLHWFRPTRPGQARGVSQFASTLDVGAQTRRYSAAVLGAAETAAKIAGVMTTDAPADATDSPIVTPMEEVELPRQGLLTLPAGAKAEAFDAKQPTQSHKEFIETKYSELGRPVLAPRNVVTGDSSGFNFASGKLDALPYQRSGTVERDRFESRVLDRIFLAWVQEALLVGLIPDSLASTVNEWTWTWAWPAPSSINPIDDAKASQLRLQLNLSTLAIECSALGLNWREVIDQRAIEREYMIAKGIDPDTGLGIVKKSVTVAETGDEDDPADPAAPDDEEVPADAK